MSSREGLDILNPKPTSTPDVVARTVEKNRPVSQPEDNTTTFVPDSDPVDNFQFDTFGGGDFELWVDHNNGGRSYAVWLVDVPDGPDLPIAYEVRDSAAFERIWGADPSVDIEVVNFRSGNPINRTGFLVMGPTSLVPPEQWRGSGDVLDPVVARFEKQVAVFPWLDDPEILAEVLSAKLEKRPVDEIALTQTNWYQTHTEAERNWLTFAVTDPSSANERLADQRSLVRDMLEGAGIRNPGEGVIDTIATKVTTGQWSTTFANRQISLLADPTIAGTLAPALRGQRGDTTRGGELQVRALLTEWLGPGFGGMWNPQMFERWAGRIRNDPDAQTELMDMLRAQRLALFPTYENPNLTYEDIAGPWRELVGREWGEIADETDPLFAQIINLNSAVESQKLLRTEGLKRGNPTVVNNALRGLATTLGGPIRRSDPAVL